MSPIAPIPVGVSSCLCGERVRYDGRDKRDRLISERLASIFSLTTICPEVAIGLPVPRPPIHLVVRRGRVEAVGVDDPHYSVSQPLRQLASQLTATLSGLSGYICKGRSPSCGLGSTPVSRSGHDAHPGNGLFIATVRERFPLMPMVEAEQLVLPEERRRFVEQVLFYHRFRPLLSERPAITPLRRLFEAYRIRLLSHSPASTRRLATELERFRGRLNRRQQLDWLTRMMAILQQPVTAHSHGEALSVLIRPLAGRLSKSAWQGVNRTVDELRLGIRSLDAIKGVVRLYLLQAGDEVMAGDGYLNPDPVEITLEGW